MGQIGFSNHLANHMTGQSSVANIDLITGLENGGSPTMSPSSPGQVAQDMSQMKIEDRKVPRPIGTERAWKNYNAAGMTPASDVDPMNWMPSNEKMVGSWASLAPGMDRHQMFRSNQVTAYSRLTGVEDLHQIMDPTYSVSLH